MKTWTRIFGVAATFALSTACTVTVGSGVDDSDDLDFTDKSNDTETSDTDTSVGSTETSTNGTESTSTDETLTSSEPASSSTSETSTSSESTGETTEPVEPNACNGSPEPYSCEDCANSSCQAEWQACCASEGCVATWTAIYTCIIDNPSEDPWDAFDDCAAGASDTGDQLDLPVEVQDLYSCVNAPFTGDSENDRFGRMAGEGTCTLLCYNVTSLD